MDDVFEIPEHLLEKGVSLKTSKNKPKSSFDNTHLLEKGVSPKNNVFDRTFSEKVQSVDSKKDYNDTKNGKKKVEKETIEKADMYEQMKTMIKQQLEEEEKNKKRKYDRKKPTSEKTVSEEYKQKLRDNMAKARANRKITPKESFDNTHLLEKGVSPKNNVFDRTFSEKVQSVEEKVQNVEEEVKAKIEEIKPKIDEKPSHKSQFFSEKPKESVEKPKESFDNTHLLEKGVSPKNNVFDRTFSEKVQSVVEKPTENLYSMIKRPFWFKK